MRTAPSEASYPAGYQARHDRRETNRPCPFGFRHVTPAVRDQQVNTPCRHVFPYGSVT
jgi:hypothetical protein